MAPGHLAGFSIASNGEVASAVNAIFPGVQQFQIESFKIFYISCYKNKVVIYGDCGNMRVSRRRCQTFAVAFAYQSTLDPCGSVIECQDTVLKLPDKVLLDPLLKAFPTRLFFHFVSATNEFADCL